MQNIWYLDNNGEFQSTEVSTYIQLEDMLQRMQTFKGEQSFNANNGVDYISVFNRKAFLTPQLNAIASLYNQYFRDITIVQIPTGNPDQIQENINVTLFSGEVQSQLITI